MNEILVIWMGSLLMMTVVMSNVCADLVVIPISSQYQIIDLGTLEGSTSSEAYGINNLGQVVGWSGNRSFLWNDGEMIDLGVLENLDDDLSIAWDINELGQVVGTSWHTVPVTKYHAFLWNDDNGNGQSDPDEMIYLGWLGGSSFEWSFAYSINNVCQVVGKSSWIIGERPFLWTEYAGMIDLGSISGTNNGATSINNLGQVVGWCNYLAFFWEDTNQNGQSDPGEMIEVGPGYASDINDQQIICGQSDHYTAVIWENIGRNWEMTELETFPENIYHTARAINNRNQIVGYSRTAYPDLSELAVIWKNGLIQDLNDLIPTNSGWILREAYDINDVGQIVGYGEHNGETRAFLLTPTIIALRAEQLDAIPWGGG